MRNGEVIFYLFAPAP